MSFYTLLILLSLIIIVPIFFLMKEKSKHTQRASIQQHQSYLAAADRAARQSQIKQAATETTTSNKPATGLSVIHFSAQHPFVQWLYDEQVPKAFRVTMDSIGQQYESTHHAQITESQLFTLNKLITTRIPELIADYLSLDQHYAKTVVIDVDKQNSSYDIVLEQLNSILDFSQKLNTQSQSGVVNKLLASRRYLDDVYRESGKENDVAADSLKIK